MKLDPKAALVVLSGGQDSTTCLGWALENYERVICITFDYGQRHAREIAAAEQVVEHFNMVYPGISISHEVIKIDPSTFAGMSPLTNANEELETYANAEEMDAIIGDRVEKTFVPMRNAVFLMIAANRAAVAGVGNIVTGVCQADNANYPDCRESFIAYADACINEALGLEKLSEPKQICIKTPLMDMSKAQSVHLALATKGTYAALAFSHTAYDGKYPPNGSDHASILRAHGFEVAGVPDPLVMRAAIEGLMDLPETLNYAAHTTRWDPGEVWDAQVFANRMNAKRHAN